MVIVHVWDSAWLRYAIPKRSGSPGHAALQLNPEALTPETGYVSLHPGPQGIGKGRKLKSLREDVQWYETKKQEHWSLEVDGLYEEKMLAAWEKFRKSSIPYSFKDFCSSIVHDLLVAGGADRYATGWGSWVIGAWSPADVRDYTESVVRGLEKEGSRR